MVGPLRAAVLLTSVVAASVGATAHSWNRPPREHAAAVETPVVERPAPQLTIAKTPLRASTTAGTPAMVTVTGRGFEAGVTMTLTSPFYVFTFGPKSLDDLHAESFRFNAEPIPGGIYDLTVSIGAGRPSNAVTFVMQRK
jgi:hypothetical protein